MKLTQQNQSANPEESDSGISGFLPEQDPLSSFPDAYEADDADDAFLLAIATEGDADYLVTGDHRSGLLQRGSIGRTRIVNPAEFCAKVL